MSAKNYKIFRLVITILSTLAVIFSITSGNYFIAVAFLGVFAGIILIAKKSVTEIMADERDYETAGKAAVLALQINNTMMAILSLILFAFRESNTYFEVVATVLAFSACFLMILYSLLFKYYNHIAFTKKKWAFIIVGVICIILTGLGVVRLFSSEDGWVCDKGVWVEHGHPENPKPTIECK